MEGFDIRFNRGRKPAFEEAPVLHRRSLHGVDYLHLRGLQGGDLFVTRLGWPVVEALLPDQWFVGRRFCKVGRALAGATGAVYQVPVAHPHSPRFALVVKFSRFAQDTSVTILDPALQDDADLKWQVANAQFLPPFQEVANLLALRSSPGSRVLTAQPLAVYSPPTRYAAWELGRKNYSFKAHQQCLAESQRDLPEDRRVAYDSERMYILLYRWIEGIDAEEALDRGLLDESQMRSLTEHARQTIIDKGWLVLDHKPKHVIVRPAKDGQSLRDRAGWPLWAVIDYELLLPREDQRHRP